MIVAMGSCCTCKKQLVFLRVKENRVIVVVGCPNCREEMQFDLHAMVDALFNETVDHEQMLRDFNPKGKPS